MNIQEIAGRWERRAFPDRPIERLMMKLAEEMGEVFTEVNKMLEPEVHADKGEVRFVEEAADVVLGLLQAVDTFFPGRNLMLEVNKKLSILHDPSTGHRAARRWAGMPNPEVDNES
jgi:hypothetical protein